MSFSWTTNTTPTTGPVAMYSLIAKMVAQGWLVKADSDGTTYNSTGGQVTSGATGAHGLGNNNAWVRLQGQDGTEFTIQRATVDYQFRMKISMAAHFTGGSPGATQTPSATDEFLFCGGGTDAAPTFAQMLPTTNGGYRYSCGVDGAVGGGFWSAAFPVGGGAPNHAWVFDPLTNTTAGDGYAKAIYLNSTASFLTSTLCIETYSQSTPNGIIATAPKLAPTGSDWIAFPAMSYYNPVSGRQNVPSGLPTNPITGNDEAFPMVLMRGSAQATPGYKGILSVMKWHGVSRATAGDLVSLSTTRDRIIFQTISLPWDGSVLVV